MHSSLVGGKKSKSNLGEENEEAVETGNSETCFSLPGMMLSKPH